MAVDMGVSSRVAQSRSGVVISMRTCEMEEERHQTVSSALLREITVLPRGIHAVRRESLPIPLDTRSRRVGSANPTHTFRTVQHTCMQCIVNLAWSKLGRLTSKLCP